MLKYEKTRIAIMISGKKQHHLDQFLQHLHQHLLRETIAFIFSEAYPEKQSIPFQILKWFSCKSGSANNYFDEKDFNKRPLAKLTEDIYCKMKEINDIY